MFQEITRTKLVAGALAASGVALAAWSLSRTPARGVLARRGVTILAPRHVVYATWRRLDNLPRFLEHVTEVTELHDERSSWTVKEGPWTLSWEARITDDVAGHRIAWESLPGADVDNAGSVELYDAPGDRGTEVIVTIHYRPPGGGLVGAPLRGLLRRFTGHQLDVELRRLRQLLETGELAVGAPSRAYLPAHDVRALAQGRV